VPLHSPEACGKDYQGGQKRCSCEEKNQLKVLLPSLEEKGKKTLCRKHAAFLQNDGAGELARGGSLRLSERGWTVLEWDVPQPGSTEGISLEACNASAA